MMRSFDVPTLPVDLTAAIERAGYYPALVGDVVAAALTGEEVRSHLVHLETTFDRDVIRRHVTVLVLTPSRLVIAHADDHADDHADEAAGAGVTDGAGAAGSAGHGDGGSDGAGAGGPEVATATTESIPLSAVRGVMLTHVVADPQNYVPGSLGRELTLTLGWGAVSRVDLLPATCGDPGCDADHGYDGTISSDDIALRVSATADGDAALQQAIAFAHALSGSLGQ